MNDRQTVHEILKTFDYKWSSKSSRNPKKYLIMNDCQKVYEILKIFDYKWSKSSRNPKNIWL